MPRYPYLERMLHGKQPEPTPNQPAYWADGPVFRIEAPHRTVYYRGVGFYPKPPEWVPPPYRDAAPYRDVSCVECGGMNTTESISGSICMGCYTRRRAPPLPPPVPRFTKADAAKILGVPWPGATEDDVRDAYRTLVLEAHADRGGNDARFIEITKARDRMIPPPKQAAR